MTLREDISTIKLLLYILIATVIISSITIITIESKQMVTSQQKAEQQQEVEITSYSGYNSTLWYKGKAEIVSLNSTTIEFIDDQGLNRVICFTGILTITKYE